MSLFTNRLEGSERPEILKCTYRPLHHGVKRPFRRLDCPPTPESVSRSSESPGLVPSVTAIPNAQDVAIVGISCRTAGGNDTPEKLWKFLMEKRHASGHVPTKRWEPWLQRDPRNANIIANTTSKGYFIDDLEKFDAAFFGISPKEAELMDPHQRLALELSWEALENAGIDPKKLSGSDTSVFMGVDSDDYSRLIMEDLPNIEAWSGIGTAYHGIPNRISYHFNLHGTSTAVDAACASSLIAIHLGRQAILVGESLVALCGGVNVLCAPALTYMLDKAGALSSDGVCISFDDNAHGYARGEGGAIVVLKRLSSAIVDNDNILAVLKSTATAQDGKTNGIMAPNAKAQEMVARQALLRAGGLDPLTIGYIEAHATSTSLGDPTEIGAMAKVYGVGRDSDRPCAIGSIKPNVGHLEAAAGAIGFVKAVMAVHKGELAPQTLLKKLNTRVDWDRSGLQVVQEASTWLETQGPRRAAICSYGYGGSVAHAIIEQGPSSYDYGQETTRYRVNGEPEKPVILTLSSFQEKRLPHHAIQLADWLAGDGQNESLVAIAATLSQRRAAQHYRVTFVVDNHIEAIRTLREYASGVCSQWVTSSRVLETVSNRGVVWVFSGHGAQWPGMAKELLKDDTFYHTIERLDELVEKEAGFSALSALRNGDIGGTSRVQVLTYLTQFALSQVLRNKGIEPQAIIGHSVGEIAAAVVAGCLTPEEGVLLVSRRASLYAQVEGHGGMALVFLPFSQVRTELGPRRDIVAAIDSSPSSCVVSGEVAPLKHYLVELASRGVKTFRVETDIAFHSPMLKKLVTPLERALLGALNPHPATTLIYSTSHIDPRTDAFRGTNYWVANMIEPVRLNEAVSAAVHDGYRIFLEVSTHPIVTHSISEIMAAQEIEESAAISVMKRDTSSDKSVLHAVAQLHSLGASVDFATQLGASDWAKNVPGTPWVQKPYWKKVETGTTEVHQRHTTDEHTLLGQALQIAGSDMRIFTTVLDETMKPYPLTHPLDGTEILPAAVYCNTFRRATDATVLDDLQLRIPTPMTADQRDIQVIVEGCMVRLSSRLRAPGMNDGNSQHAWTEHSCCNWSKLDKTPRLSPYDIDAIKERIGKVLPRSFAWDFLQKIGVSGVAFPWTVLQHLGNEKEMIVRMDMDPEHDTMNWDSHSWAPFLDAATSVGSSIFFNDPQMRIVSGIDQVQFVSEQTPPKFGYLYIQEKNDSKSLAADVSILSEQGELLVKLKSMRFSELAMASNRTTGVDTLVHRLAWIPPVFSEKPLEMDHVLIICDDQERSKVYARDVRVHARTVLEIFSVDEINSTMASELLSRSRPVVIYVPGHSQSFNEVPVLAHKFTWEVACALKHLATLDTAPRFIVITDSIFKASSPTALAQAPLYGLARIAAQEYPELWGGLIDNEQTCFPSLAVKYVLGQDVIRVQDGLPRIAKMRPFTKNERRYKNSDATFLPKPYGTYVVTGGFGDLGLEVLAFLVEKGARRIVVVSRSNRFTPRREWTTAKGRMKVIADRMNQLEKQGATIYSVALDISGSDADTRLLAELDRLCLPPVLGVVHAAGISEDGLIKDATSASFSRVFAPKVSGALTLHKLFPPATLDFFILFSSIGQLVGTSGQAPYGAANAFLDSLATHRRQQGDNAIAIQWTAWRGLGLAADSEFLTAELHSKGITDITRSEAFQAWEYLDRHDTDHAVVTRARILDADDPAPFALVSEIAPRRARSVPLPSPSTSVITAVRPKSGPELKAWLSIKIRECIGGVLHIDIDEIDIRAAVADLGVDSVMTVAVRQKLQSVLGVKVPPTLLWKEPTVGHLVEWFRGKIEVLE